MLLHHPADPRHGEVLRTGATVVHGGGGKGGGSQTSTTTSEPWSEQQFFLKDVFNEARKLHGDGVGQIVGPGETSRLAQQMTRNLALGGQPGLESALLENRRMMEGTGQDAFSEQLRAEARGDYLNANPYLDAMFDQAAGRVGTQFNSLFAGGGRTGSGSHAETLAGGLSDMATQIYGGNYAQERDRQQLAARTGLSGINQAIARQPGLESAQYLPTQMLGGVGAQEDSLAQARANLPWLNLGQYASLIQGGYGGTTTTTQPMYSNPAAGILGGASSGAGVGMMIGGPMGAGIGAGAGALLGLL